MSSTANRVIKNTGYLYAKMGITMFISLYTTRLILNSLGASDFGIFNIVGGAIAMLGFLNAAMAGATQRFMSYCEGEGDKEKQKSIFNISLVLHFFIALLLGIVLWIAGYFFFNGILNIPADRIFAAKVIYGSLIVSTLFTVMTVPYDAVMNAHENMKYYAVVGIIESILKLAVAFAVVYTSSDKLIVYGLLMACIPVITMAIMRVYCHKHYVECVFAPKQYWNRGLMRGMTGFAGWNFLTSSSAITSQYGFGLVLNHFFGTILNAALGVGNQLCGQLQVFSSTMLKAINPLVAKSEGAGDRKLMLTSVLEGCKVSYLLMALFSFPALIEMPYIMNLWLRNVPLWAVLFCQLQIVRTLIEQLTVLLSNAIAAHGDIKNYSIYKSIINIAPIAITYILFSYGFAPYWMYVNWILFWGVFLGILSLMTSKRLCGLSIRQYLKAVFYPCMIITIICMVIILIIHYLLDEGFIRLIIVFISSMFTLIVSWWYVVATAQEKEVVSKLYVQFMERIKINNKTNL